MTTRLKDEMEIPKFDISLVNDELTNDAKKIMDQFKEKTVIVSELLTSIEKYDNIIRVLSDNLLFGFEHLEFRDCPVTYKIKNEPGEEARWLPFRLFIINLILWRPQFCLDPDSWNESLIMTPAMKSRAGVAFLARYFNENYVLKYNTFIPSMPNLLLEDIIGELSEILGETTFILQQTTSKFSNFFGISSNIEVFKRLAEKIPEFNDLMHFTLDESKQPYEMEQDLDKAQKRLVEIIMEDDNFNMLKPLMANKSGLNMKQVRDMVINSGLKPGFNGSTIAQPINTNFLAGGGFRGIVDNYINAISGRKAAMINNEFMGRTGHLLILIAISTAMARLSKTCMDCNTVNPIPMEIKTPTHLAKMNGRRYRFRGEKDYRILNASKDEHLIGEIVEFRTPITCACKDGICRECYGDLYYTNIDNISQGIYSATIVMNPVVQGILSAKHHQSTNTSPIIFEEPFSKFFSLYSTDVIIDIDESLEVSDYCLILRQEDVALVDGEDADLDFEKTRRRRKKKKKEDADEDEFGMGPDDSNMDLDLKYYVTKFQVAKWLHTKGKDPEYFDISEQEGKELYIHEDFIAKTIPDEDEFGKYRYIELEDIDPEEFIFIVDVENNELTKPMKEIQKVLNNKDHAGCHTFEQMTNKMLDLMIASKLDAMGVHAEMIIRELIRRKNNVLRRPDFSKYVMSNDVEIMTINSALKKNPSITTSMSTQYLKDQLVNLSETFAKSATSVFDPYYRATLATQDDLEDAKRRKASYQDIEEIVSPSMNTIPNRELLPK